LAHVPLNAGTDLASALMRAEILIPSEQLAFVQPLVRDAVLGGPPPPKLQKAHAPAAAVHAQDGTPREQVAARVVRAAQRFDKNPGGTMSTAVGAKTHPTADVLAQVRRRRDMRGRARRW
jgi:hypothetical protein